MAISKNERERMMRSESRSEEGRGLLSTVKLLEYFKIRKKFWKDKLREVFDTMKKKK